MFIKLIKRMLVIFICMLCLFIHSEYSEYKNGDTIEVMKNIESESVIYERIGANKGVYLYNSLLDNKKILNIITDKYYIDKNIGMFYMEGYMGKGIYTYPSDIKENKINQSRGYMIFENYNPITQFKKIGDNIFFISSNIENKDNIVWCKYNIKDNKIQTKAIPIYYDSYIRDEGFVDNNTIIYSKKPKIKNSNYQIYTYDIEKNIETQITNLLNDAINPVISYDKKSIAYIRREGNVYRLFVYNTQTKNTTKIKIKDAVVGGSVVWSYDNKNIICTTLNNGYKNILEVISIEDNLIYSVDNVYSGIFTNDNKSILVASYNYKENLQCLYKVDLKTKQKKLIYSFYENGSFSRSVRILMQESL